jgi:hypothetical protein
MMAVASRIPMYRGLLSAPAEDIYDVRAMPVNHHGGALMFEIVDATADECIALRLEVGDERGYIRVPGKPRFYGLRTRGDAY